MILLRKLQFNEKSLSMDEFLWTLWGENCRFMIKVIWHIFVYWFSPTFKAKSFRSSKTVQWFVSLEVYIVSVSIGFKEILEPHLLKRPFFWLLNSRKWILFFYFFQDKFTSTLNCNATKYFAYILQTRSCQKKEETFSQ